MSVTIEGIKFHLVNEVATKLHITPQTVRRYIQRGELKGKKIGRSILIPESALKEFLNLDAKKN